MVPEPIRQHGKPKPAFPTKGYHANVMHWSKERFAELVERFLTGEEFLEEHSIDGDSDLRRTRINKHNCGGAKIPGRKAPPTLKMQFVAETMHLVARSRESTLDYDYLEELHNRHEQMTKYFVSTSKSIPFLCLLRMHFTSTVWAAYQAIQDVENFDHPGIQMDNFGGTGTSNSTSASYLSKSGSWLPGKVGPRAQTRNWSLRHG